MVCPMSSGAVLCPGCQHALKVLGQRAGQWRTRCPRCRLPVLLIIHDPAQAPTIERLPADETPPPEVSPAIPETLGGYRILRRLGEGGMGTVYLARQLSLNRNVALKVLSREWQTDPRFLARFVREAHAAAQLVHHNIVQIYDIGNDGAYHFFSMEYVQGQTLSELVAQRGKLDHGVALDYILQAARGLQVAHAQGLVHRDIKPDNLMLNEQGIIKVADLGLVKTADPEIPAHEELPPGKADVPTITRLGTGMGTPAYIAPEQARNAASVDARADIYSLGCTFHVLLTGRPPFVGQTAMEVMLKHLSEPPRPPENLQPQLPPALWAILERMLAKKVEDRFEDMGALIAALEGYRRAQSDNPAMPTEEDAAKLTRYVKQFNDIPLARTIPWTIATLLGACALLLVPCALLQFPRLALALMVFPVMALLCRALLLGWLWRSALLPRIRTCLQLASLWDWIALGGVVLGAPFLLWLLGLLGAVAGGTLVAVILAGTFHFLVDRPIHATRQGVLEKARTLLQRMRLRGIDEPRTRRFVAEYAGQEWEAFYEGLFGYEQLRQAKREQIPDATGHPRAFGRTFRDQFADCLDERIHRGRLRLLPTGSAAPALTAEPAITTSPGSPK